MTYAPVHRDEPPAGAREIPGFEGRYFATPDGRIWSHFAQKFLNPGKPRKDGYFYVMPRLNGRNVNRAVHRLVCAAFHGAPAPGMEANHDDLVKTNNAASNLEWVTPKANTEHAWKNLPAETIAWMRERRSFGAIKMNRKKRKLTPADVAKARALLARGESNTQTAAAVGICRQSMDRLVAGETYRD